MAEQYCSIKVIMDQLLQHSMLQDLTFETVVRDTVEFTELMGVPTIYVSKSATIKLSNYRGVLPKDWVQTEQIMYSTEGKNYFLKYDHGTGLISNNMPSDYTFKIQGNYIYSSIQNATLTLYYKAMQVDETGLPMIPDNTSFIRGVNAYIKLKHFTILFDLGKIRSDVLTNAQQDYAWAAGACQSEFNRVDPSQMESIMESINSILPTNKSFAHGFTNPKNNY